MENNCCSIRSNENSLYLLQQSISQPYKFSDSECEILELFVHEVMNLGNGGFFKKHTIDRTLLRNKYFFGERYTYGSQMPQRGLGMERLYPQDFVDPIPAWIYYYVINPLISANIISENFVNSAAINVYQPGGCIVSHIDPPQIFDRPIISVSLMSDSTLCFGCKFDYKPIRCSEPFFKLSLPRGIVTLINGFAADEITHCVRPEDTEFQRAVILLRRVLPDAPRLSQLDISLENNNLKIAAGHSSKSIKNNLKVPDVHDKTFRTLYEKYSKVYKEKQRLNFGGISKPAYSRKTFFADNKRFLKKSIDKSSKKEDVN